MLASRKKTKLVKKRFAKAAVVDAPAAKGLPNVHAATLFLKQAMRVIGDKRAADLSAIDLAVISAYKALTEKSS